MSNKVQTKNADKMNDREIGSVERSVRQTAHVSVITFKLVAIVGLALSAYLLSQPQVRFAITNRDDVNQAMELRSTHNAALKLHLE